MDGWIETCHAKWNVPNHLGQIKDKHKEPKCGGALNKEKQMTYNSIDANLSKSSKARCHFLCLRRTSSVVFKLTLKLSPTTNRELIEFEMVRATDNAFISLQDLAKMCIFL